ncbi:MAG: PDZ domain-containing protein [Sediminibacterium sp.]|nr:PDZ domain-containing protein [Sediminibacterium sp.]
MKMLPIALLALCISLGVSAQTKEKVQKETQEKIIIRTKGAATEKMTIIVDGDKITVNGKPVEDLKDLDIEILNEKSPDHLSLKSTGRIGPMGNHRVFGEGFASSGNRAFLGVVTEKTDKGAKINSIVKESAAEKAGLKKEDVITKIGTNKIEGSDDLFEAIGKYKPEDTITISYLRDGKEATANARLGKSTSPGIRSFNFNNDHFNMEVPGFQGLNGMNFNFNRKPQLGLQIQDVEEGKGVKIVEVNDNTPAAKAGLLKDDLITEIDGKPITSVDDLKATLKNSKEGDSIKLSYQRAGKTETTNIKFPKKLKTADL